MTALLRAQRADIEATMQLFDRLGAQARRLAPALVPTHGDPNLANVLLDGMDRCISLTGASWRLADVNVI